MGIFVLFMLFSTNGSNLYAFNFDSLQSSGGLNTHSIYHSSSPLMTNSGMSTIRMGTPQVQPVSPLQPHQYPPQVRLTSVGLERLTEMLSLEFSD